MHLSVTALLIAILTLVGGAGVAHGVPHTVREPSNNIPHIHAATDVELFEEYGRQAARDRLGQFVLLAYLMLIGYFSLAMLIPFLALPSLKRVWEVYRHPRPSEPPADLPQGVWPLYCVATAFWYNRRFGMWFLLGLVLDVGVSRLA